MCHSECEKHCANNRSQSRHSSLADRQPDAIYWRKYSTFRYSYPSKVQAHYDLSWILKRKQETRFDQHEGFEEAGIYYACIAADVDASALSQPRQGELLDRVIVRDD